MLDLLEALLPPALEVAIARLQVDADDVTRRLPRNVSLTVVADQFDCILFGTESDEGLCAGDSELDEGVRLEGDWLVVERLIAEFV